MVLSDIDIIGQDNFSKKDFEGRIAKEESEVSTHAISMASRRKKDQDKSTEGGIWYYKNRSELEEN